MLSLQIFTTVFHPKIYCNEANRFENPNNIQTKCVFRNALSKPNIAVSINKQHTRFESVVCAFETGGWFSNKCIGCANETTVEIVIFFSFFSVKTKIRTNEWRKKLLLFFIWNQSFSFYVFVLFRSNLSKIPKTLNRKLNWLVMLALLKVMQWEIQENLYRFFHLFTPVYLRTQSSLFQLK